MSGPVLQPSTPAARSSAPLSETVAWPTLGDAAVPHRKKGVPPPGPVLSSSDQVHIFSIVGALLPLESFLRRCMHVNSDQQLLSVQVCMKSGVHTYMESPRISARTAGRAHPCDLCGLAAGPYSSYFRQALRRQAARAQAGR